MPREDLSDVEGTIHPDLYDKVVALVIVFKQYLNGSIGSDQFLRQIKMVADDIDLSLLPSESDNMAAFLKNIDNPSQGSMRSLSKMSMYYNKIGLSEVSATINSYVSNQ